MAEEPEDKSFLQGVLEEEGEKNRNVLLSYVNVLGGAASRVKDMADVDVWPDVHRVNRLVDVWTVVGYCFAFGNLHCFRVALLLIEDIEGAFSVENMDEV